MSDYQTRSFWLGHKPYTPNDRLEGDRKADLVIMGGGYTGLWSAIHLKDADPSGESCHVAKQTVARLDSLSGGALTRPETRDGPVGVRERVVGCRREQVEVVGHDSPSLHPSA